MTLKIVLHVNRDNYKDSHEMMQSVIPLLDQIVDGGYVYSAPDEDGEAVAITHAELHVDPRPSSSLALAAFNPDDNTTGE